MRTVEKLLIGFVVLCVVGAVVVVATAPLRAQETPPAPPAGDTGGMAMGGSQPAPALEPPTSAEAQGGPGLTSPPTGGPTAGGAPTGTQPTAQPQPIPIKPTPPAIDYAKDADRQRAEFRADIARRKHPWDKKEMYENERAWRHNVQQNDYNWAPDHKQTGSTCGDTWWHEYCGN
jgi:hypothetical protein